MSTIGTFTKTGDGFTGKIATLQLTADVTIRPIEANVGSEKGPHYRLFAGTAEIGAAWHKTTRDGEREYLSVSIDDPSFSNPIAANFVPGADATYNLIWSRK